MRLRRFTPRLALVLDAQRALLNFSRWGVVTRNLRQPALVGRLIHDALLDPLNTTIERQGDLRTEARGQAQGEAHWVVPSLGQVERAQFRIGFAEIGHWRHDLLFQDLDCHRVFDADAHGMPSEAFGVGHNQVVR